MTAPKEEYVDKYQRWINDLEVSQFVSHLGRVLTEEAEEGWYQAQAESDEPTFTIHYLPDDRPIGNCGLHNIDRGKDHAEMGILLGEKEYWNRGLEPKRYSYLPTSVLQRLASTGSASVLRTSTSGPDGFTKRSAIGRSGE